VFEVPSRECGKESSTRFKCRVFVSRIVSGFKCIQRFRFYVAERHVTPLLVMDLSNLPEALPAMLTKYADVDFLVKKPAFE